MLATLPAWLPWLDPQLDLWKTDDAKNHMLRLYHLGWLLERGVLHPRWVPDMFMGYGYPLFNFYAPAFYYVSLLLGWIFRLDVWDAFKAGGVLSVLLGSSGVYALTYAVWRRVAPAMLAAVLLPYQPYVFQINFFKRADLPEALALGLIPWLLLAIHHLWHAATRPARLIWLCGAAAVGTAILLTHNLTALLAAALALVWLLALLATGRDWFALGRVVQAGGLALGLSAFFWLPAVGETRLVQLDELWGTGGLDWRGWMVEPTGLTDKDHKPGNLQTPRGLLDLNLHYPHQLIAAPKLSLGQTMLGLLTGILLLRAALGRKHGAAGAGLLFLTALGCWFLTFTVSAPVWEHVPGLALFQFPWRFLGPLGICLTVAAAGAVAMATTTNRHAARGTTKLNPLSSGRSLAAQWSICIGVGALFIFNSLGARQFPTAAQPQRAMDGTAVVRDERHDYVVAGTTTNREFLPHQVRVAPYTPGLPRHIGVFEHLYPDIDWLGGTLQPVGGDLRLLGWRAEPLRLSVRIANDAASTGTLGVRQLQFDGWRVWLNGQRADSRVPPYVPEQQMAPGFLLVDVPPGEHTISLSFGPSIVRVVALGATLATSVLLVMLLAWHSRTRRTRGEWLLCACALILALFCLLGIWRGVRPLLGRHSLLVPVAQQTNGVWHAPDLSHTGSGLIVNVAHAVQSGQARIASPSGTALGPDRFVDVRQLTVTDHDTLRGAAGTSRREWLYLHPPAGVSVDIALPPRGQLWFQAALTLDPRVWSAEVGDGVRFLATVEPTGDTAGSTSSTVVLDEIFNPRADTAQRRWVPVRANLSPWAGRTVRLTLYTSPRDETSFDWAGWGNPVVVVADTARDVLTHDTLVGR